MSIHRIHNLMFFFTIFALLAVFALVLSAHAMTVKESVVVPQGLVGYWNFDRMK